MNKQIIKPPEPKIFDDGYTAIFLNNDAADTSTIESRSKAEGYREQPNKHITIIGDSKAKIIKSAIDKININQRSEIEEKIKPLLNQFNWSFTPQEIYHITKTKKFGGDDFPLETRLAYIVTIDMPDMEKFYQALNNLLGTSLPTHFPHITLFTKGEGPNPKYYGIPIPSLEEFNNCQPHLINN